MENHEWLAITSIENQEYRIPVTATDSVSAMQKAAARFRSLFKDKQSLISDDWTIRVVKTKQNTEFMRSKSVRILEDT